MQSVQLRLHTLAANEPHHSRICNYSTVMDMQKCMAMHNKQVPKQRLQHVNGLFLAYLKKYLCQYYCCLQIG